MPVLQNGCSPAVVEKFSTMHAAKFIVKQKVDKSLVRGRFS